MPRRHQDSRLRSPAFALWQVTRRAEEAAEAARRVRRMADSLGGLDEEQRTVIERFAATAERAAAVAVEARRAAEREAHPHGPAEAAGPETQEMLKALRHEYRIAVDATEAVHLAEHELRRVLAAMGVSAPAEDAEP